MSAKIELPGVDFGALANELIAVKLTEALVMSPEGVRGIVQAALGVKVSPDNGQPPRYSSDKTIPWVEHVAGDMIRAVTKRVLQERVEAMAPQIAKEVESQLKKSNSVIAKTLVDGFAAACKQGYYVSVNVGRKE